MGLVFEATRNQTHHAMMPARIKEHQALAILDIGKGGKLGQCLVSVLPLNLSATSIEGIERLGQ